MKLLFVFHPAPPLVRICWLFCVLAQACSFARAQTHRIVTADEHGTYIQIGNDLSRLVAQPAGIELEAVASKGSAENVQRLRYEAGVRLALVQSDVIQAFIDQAAAGNGDALRLIKPLRAVMPLYNEEVYVVARADSPLNFVHEIRDKRINVGRIGSGTALTATTLYRKLFGESIADANISHLANDEALVGLTSQAPPIDAVVVVAGQPTPLFAQMTAESRQHIKLLRFDPQAPGGQAVTETYSPTVIRAANYPNLLTEDVPTLATKAVLVTYDYQAAPEQKMLTLFARSLCSNFDKLKAEGHVKWQDVQLDMPALGKGWRYYAPTRRELLACGARQRGRAVGPRGNDPSCSQVNNVLGLCGATGEAVKKQPPDMVQPK